MAFSQCLLEPKTSVGCYDISSSPSLLVEAKGGIPCAGVPAPTALSQCPPSFSSVHLSVPMSISLPASPSLCPQSIPTSPCPSLRLHAITLSPTISLSPSSSPCPHIPHPIPTTITLPPCPSPCSHSHHSIPMPTTLSPLPYLVPPPLSSHRNAGATESSQGLHSIFPVSSE